MFCWGQNRKKTAKVFIAGIILGQFSTISVAHTQLPAKKNHSLEKTVRENLNGLKLESKEENDELLKDAKLYAAIRHGAPKKKETSELVEECSNDSSRSPFCILLAESESKNKEKQNTSSKISYEKSHQKRIHEVYQWILQGQTDLLNKAKEQEIREALRQITSLDEIKKVSDQTLEASQCKNPQLSLLLASKTEEFLPDSDVRARAIELYEKASPCGDSEITAKAKFRLSLLHIWKNDCKTALSHLKSLAQQVNFNDYRSRALFWQHHCAVQTKEEKTMSQAKQTLVEKYPFSLHTLLIQKEIDQDFPKSYQQDSEILYRSKLTPDLNPRIIATEALIAIHEEQLAREAIDKSTSELENSEPEFRIYAGILYHRLELYLKKFKVLNSAFKDNPSLISKAALDLYYAQNALQVTDLSRIEVDGLLLLSLIRQESAFNTKARSPAGALGLMQIMPTTARRFARIRRMSELLNPKTNIRIGSKYFSNLMKNYGGDAELALAAYNAGPHRVDQWLKRYPVKDRVLFLDLIPFKETREYVASIARNYFWYVTLSSTDEPKFIGPQLEEKPEIKSPRKNIAKVFSLFATSL